MLATGLVPLGYSRLRTQEALLAPHAEHAALGPRELWASQLWATLLNTTEAEAHWLAQCPQNARALCAKWQRKVRKAFADDRAFKQQRARQANFQGKGSTSSYNPFEPVWGSCASKERVPTLRGDGPKWMCGASPAVLPANATVYSFGSAGDTSWEDEMHRRLPGAKIFTFDPTLRAATESKIKRSRPWLDFSHEALTTGGVLHLQGHRLPGSNMSAIMRRLGHDFVDVVKMDIEGSEHAVIGEVCPHTDLLLMEAHGRGHEENVRLFGAIASKCKLLMFSKEPNVWGPDASYCMEFSFLSARLAFRDFRNDHAELAVGAEGPLDKEAAGRA